MLDTQELVLDSTESLQPVVYVVDDDPDVRDSLCWLIESVEQAVEAFGCADDFLARLEAGPVAGCLVADLRLPGMSGLELAEKLRAMECRIPIIMITGHGDVTAAVKAFKTGCVDFIEKPFSDQALLDRVRDALARDQDQRIVEQHLETIRQRMSRLTPRESEVMSMVVVGKLNKQIASELGLSHKTVEVHRAHVMEKMGASSLADLVRMAAAAGM